MVRWPSGAVAAPPASGCHAYLSKSELLRLSTFCPTATAAAGAAAAVGAVLLLSISKLSFLLVPVNAYKLSGNRNAGKITGS